MKQVKFPFQRIFVMIIVLSSFIACNTDENDFKESTDIINENLKRGKGSEPLLSSSFSELPPRVPDGFKWGVNGHPVNSPDYYNNSSTFYQDQVDLISEFQGDVYRVNVYTNECGRVCGQHVNNCSFEDCNSCPGSPGSCAADKQRWDDFLAVFNQTDLELMIVIQQNGMVQLYDEYTAGQQTLADVYDFGYIKAGNFAADYGADIEYYQLGNEMHFFALADNPQSNGTTAADYDSNRVQFLSAMLSGMQQGIRDNDNLTPAKTIVNTGGPNWYYFKALNSTPTYAFEPDILGWDWYKHDSPENITKPWTNDALNNVVIWDILKQQFPNKDVWICENNNFYGTMEITEERNSEWIESFINGLDLHTNVKAHLVYELVDQKIYHSPLTQNGTGKEEERYYGLVTRNGLGTSYSKKTGYTTYKFKVEEVNNGLEDYIYSLFLYINIQDPEQHQTGLNYWTNELETVYDLEDLLQAFLPTTSYQRFVESQFEQLLDTPNPDPSGVTYWTNLMQQINPYTREDIIAAFCGGTQFWNQANNNNTDFVYLIFQRLVGHDPSQEGLDYWLDRLANGMTRQQMAYAMIDQEDYQRTFLVDQYDKVMRRQVDRFGDPVDYWFDRMQDGLNQQAIIERFLLSTEYWNKGIIEGYERRTNMSFY